MPGFLQRTRRFADPPQRLIRFHLRLIITCSAPEAGQARLQAVLERLASRRAIDAQAFFELTQLNQLFLFGLAF